VSRNVDYGIEDILVQGLAEKLRGEVAIFTIITVVLLTVHYVYAADVEFRESQYRIYNKWKYTIQECYEQLAVNFQKWLCICRSF